ncbi:MAG TPA: flavin reductase family protein [Acholeplasma sp.]|nr:flavin reductase family protein [Acholeplasma sp.]
MLTFDFTIIDDPKKVKIVQGSVSPRPIAWISSHNKNGIVNLAPFSYFQMLTSSLLSVSFLRLDGKMKDTPTNILDNNEAVIHIASSDLIAELDVTSKRIEPNKSEVDLTKLTLVQSTFVKVKGIKEAKIRLEVKLENHLELKNEKGLITADLLIFRIIYAHVSKDIYDTNTGYIDVIKLDPLARLAGPNYATIKAKTDFKRGFI